MKAVEWEGSVVANNAVKYTASRREPGMIPVQPYIGAMPHVYLYVPVLYLLYCTAVVHAPYAVELLSVSAACIRVYVQKTGGIAPSVSI